jgi:hypothetical protein
LQPLNSEKKRKIPEGRKMEKVKLIDNLEKAIIKSFPKKDSKLQLKIITKKVNESLGKRLSSDRVRKRLNKLEKNKYITRTSRGIYALNPIYDLDTEDGEPLSLKSEPIEIPLELRKTHTLELRAAIENWIKHFPNPPHLDNTYSRFSASIKKCEGHLLFDDLCNHLLASGFDILNKWENYKDEVKNLEILENHLLEMMELNISEIFDKLPIRFVNNYTSLYADYQCSIPRLVLDHILKDYALNLKMKNAQTDEEAEAINNEWILPIDFIADPPLLENGDSIIWGHPEIQVPCCQLLRIPNKDKDAFLLGKQRAMAFITHPPPEIESGIRKIADKMKQLGQEREAILKELKSSLYCQCFSGECRYLGGKS